MSVEPAGSRRTPAPQPFGPVRQHLSDHQEDHERGWREAPEAPAGRIPREREAPRETLAERFRQRLAEGDTDDAGEG